MQRMFLRQMPGFDMSRSKVRGELFRVHRTNGSITAYGQYSVKHLPKFSYIKTNDLRKTVCVGNPKPKKKETYFCFVCIFEYMILLILIYSLTGTQTQ